MQVTIETLGITQHDTDLRVTVDGQTIQLSLADWLALNAEIHQQLEEFENDL